MKISSQPDCYKHFYTTISAGKKPDFDAPLCVKAASLAGAASASCLAAYMIAKSQQTVKSAKANLFNVKYNEPHILAVATASVLGGLVAGCLTDDKKHAHAKLKEGIHQFVANIVSPIVFIGILNKMYSKISDRIKIPQLSGNSKAVNAINYLLKITPRVIVVAAGLITGVYTGTKLSNCINGETNSEKQRKVKILDFKYHPDDFATALAISDGSSKTQLLTGKIIPPLFALMGYETGVKR